MEERYLYRYERDSVDTFEGLPGYFNAKLRLDKHLVVKETAKGVRLENGRFVLNGAKKRYAYPTAKEAIVNFTERTRTCCSIQKSILDRSKAFLRVAEAVQKAEKDNPTLTIA